MRQQARRVAFNVGPAVLGLALARRGHRELLEVGAGAMSAAYRYVPYTVPAPTVRVVWRMCSMPCPSLALSAALTVSISKLDAPCTMIRVRVFLTLPECVCACTPHVYTHSCANHSALVVALVAVRDPP